MENPRKIDRSFKERQGVLHLLEKLKKENITYAEMDEIGSLIHKAGRSAVQPLLRHISREKSGSLISKYTYLLDFLDDSYWLDQIIHIALKRRDLELEGKSAILATLEDCGIDVTLPPFSTLLSSSSLSATELFNRLMSRGEDGLVSLLEEFACMPGEVKRSFLLELARLSDQRTVEFLEMLLRFDNPDVVKDVITALGRVRLHSAVTVLQRFRPDAEASLQSFIDQSLKRLSFIGISSQEDTPLASKLQPFHSAYAGPVDGNGFRNLHIARWREDGTIDSIDLQLHDINGLEEVCGESAEALEPYLERTTERAGQEIIEPVPPEFAIKLLCDALLKNREEQYPLPPEFMLRRRIFAPDELIPLAYIPLSRSPFKATPALLALSTTLFEDECFAGWAVDSCLVYACAEEWLRLEKVSTKKQLATALERLIENLCRDEFQPQLLDISRRLVLNADFLARTGMDDEHVKAALAAAESIKDFSLPCHLHPFLRRFAMESMIVAREALEEGYDYRDYHDEWDD